jgi:hypothetical protein
MRAPERCCEESHHTKAKTLRKFAFELTLKFYETTMHKPQTPLEEGTINRRLSVIMLIEKYRGILERVKHSSQLGINESINAQHAL